jgi:hypothetical protein
MRRAVVTAACIIPAAVLLAGCLRTDVLYDWNGNVISPPVHKAKTQVTGRHGMRGQAPVAPHPAETRKGVDVHGVKATPTAGPSSPAP